MALVVAGGACDGCRRRRVAPGRADGGGAKGLRLRDGAAEPGATRRQSAEGGAASEAAPGEDRRPALVAAGELGVLPGLVPLIPPLAAGLVSEAPVAPGGETPRPGLEASMAELEASPAELPRVVVRGEVRDWRTGVPVPRFSVDAIDGAAAKAPRRRDGSFVLRLAPGRRRLLVRARGYMPATVPIVVAEPREGANAALRIELRPAGALRGELRSSAGVAIAEATVKLGASAEATTDAQGRFAVEALPEGLYVLEVVLRGRTLLREHGIAIRAGQTTGPLRLQLAPSVERGTSQAGGE